MAIILANTTKRYARNFTGLIGMDCSEKIIKASKKFGIARCTWSSKYLFYAAPNSTITLSKAHIRRTNDKAVMLQLCFLDALPRYSNIMAVKMSNVFDEYAASCVHLSP